MQKVEFSLGNAAGWIKSPSESFAKLVRSAATEITAGSFTIMKKDGNPEPRYWSDRSNTGVTSINSLGLPNCGIEEEVTTFRMLRMMNETCKAQGKKLRVSIAGFSVEEFHMLMRAMVKHLPDVEIEINFGCPNVIVEGAQKPISSFNLKMMDEVIALCASAKERETALAVKVSPYSDPHQLHEVGTLFNKWKNLVEVVVTCNTFPNTLSFQKGKRTISGKGYGGLAGLPLKHIMLGQVAQFRDVLDPSFRIIAVGGIHTGMDLKDAFDAGADGAQIGTAYFDSDDPRIFSRVPDEYFSLFPGSII